MRCSTVDRVPRQVEEDQALAELEVAAFAAALGRHEQARALGLAELRDLDVATRGREVLVEDAESRAARTVRQRRSQQLERLAVAPRRRASSGARRLPARRFGARATRCADRSRQPPAAWRRQRVSSRVEKRARSAAPDASARRMRSALRRRSSSVGRRFGPERAASTPPAGRSMPSAPMANRRAPRPAAAGRRCRRAAWSWCTGAAARPDARRSSNVSSSGNSSGPQQLQQAEEPVRVVVERRRREEQHVAAEPAIGATARHAGSPGCPVGRRRRCASSTTSRSMPGVDGVLGQRAGVRDQRLDPTRPRGDARRTG